MPARKRKSKTSRSGSSERSRQNRPIRLRIIGGRFRGSKLQYGGDPRVRPMKERVREAIFNLVGPSIRGKHALDLFGGTGALGLEAISRGAIRATLIERHFPTAAIIRKNIDVISAQKITEVVTSNVFIWWKRGPELGSVPWVVFCSPPYDLWVEEIDQMLELVTTMIQAAPGGSVFVLESDDRFDFGCLGDADGWDVRRYSPATVGLYRK